MNFFKKKTSPVVATVEPVDPAELSRQIEADYPDVKGWPLAEQLNYYRSVALPGLRVSMDIYEQLCQDKAARGEPLPDEPVIPQLLQDVLCYQMPKPKVYYLAQLCLLEQAAEETHWLYVQVQADKQSLSHLFESVLNWIDTAINDKKENIALKDIRTRLSNNN